MAVKKNSESSTVCENPIEKEVQLFVTVTEKKARNLEKRKAKLDGYRSIVEQGGSLDPDQKAAVAKYDEVTGSLNTLKELIKTFSVMVEDTQKAAIKSQQHQLQEQQESDLNNFQKLTQITEIFKLISGSAKVQLDLSTCDEEGNSILDQEELGIVTDFNQFLNISIEAGADLVSQANEKGEKLYLLCKSSSRKLSNYNYSTLNIIYQKLLDSHYFNQLPELAEATNEQEIVNEDVVDNALESHDKDNVISDEEKVLVSSDQDVEEPNLEDDCSSISGDIKTTEFVASAEPVVPDYSETPVVVEAVEAESEEEPAEAVDEEEQVKELTIKDVLQTIEGYDKGMYIDFVIDSNSDEDQKEESKQQSSELTFEHAHPAAPSAAASYNGIPLEAAAPTVSTIESDLPTMNLPPVMMTHTPQTSIYSSSPAPKSDSLGMGQTTFGNHGNFANNSAAAQPIPENIYPQQNSFHIQEIQKPLANVDNNVLNVMQNQPTSQISGILPSARNVPDPPKAIPMPNEELSYKSFNSNIQAPKELNGLGDSNPKSNQSDAVLHMIHQQSSSLLANDVANQMLSNDVALTNASPETHYNENLEESSILKDSAESAKPGSEDLHSETNEVCVKGDHLNSAPRVNRSSNYNGTSNGTNYNGQKQGSNYRQQQGGSQPMQQHTYFQRGNNSNYRNGNQRNYNNYNDNSGGRSNFHMYQQSSYRQQDSNGGGGNMYNGGMRRGNSNPRGRGGNGRSNGRPYNRSRTFRPQSSEQQTF